MEPTTSEYEQLSGLKRLEETVQSAERYEDECKTALKQAKALRDEMEMECPSPPVTGEELVETLKEELVSRGVADDAAD